MLIEEYGDIGEVVLHLAVGIGVRRAAAHGIAHYVRILAIEKAEKRDSLHFVWCGRREREIGWCERFMRQAQVKWGRSR